MFTRNSPFESLCRSSGTVGNGGGLATTVARGLSHGDSSPILAAAAHGKLAIIVDLDDADDGCHSVTTGVSDGGAEVLRAHGLTRLLRKRTKRLLAFDPLATGMQQGGDEGRAEGAFTQGLHHGKAVCNQRRSASLDNALEVSVLGAEKRVAAVFSRTFNVPLGFSQRGAQFI